MEYTLKINWSLPRSLKRSFFVATGALKMETPCLLIVPNLAPALINAQHKPTAPFE